MSGSFVCLPRPFLKTHRFSVWGGGEICYDGNRRVEIFKKWFQKVTKRNQRLTQRCFWRVAIVPWSPGTSCSQSASCAYPYPSVLEWRDPGLKRNGSRSARFIPEQKIDRRKGNASWWWGGADRGHALLKSEARDLRFNQSGEKRRL